MPVSYRIIESDKIQMPFVANGKPAGDADKFCAICGAPQPVAAGAGKTPNADFLGEMSGKNAALLCYIPWLGWIAAIIVLASRRYRRNLRMRAQCQFHAFRGCICSSRG